MLDIPELDNLICTQLSQTDLLRCVRVSKKWHAAVTPFLWSRFSTTRQQAFARLILDDYLHEHHHQSARETHTIDQSIHPPPPSPSLPPLSKYGHCIKNLPHPTTIVECLQLIIDDSPPSQQPLDQQALQNPTLYDLMRHFYERCPVYQPDRTMSFTVDDIDGLMLRHIYKLSDSEVFLSWLWKRCSHVERLELKGVQHIPQSLVDIILTHMPNLNAILLDRIDLCNGKVDAILSKSRKGWKEVHLEEILRQLEESTVMILMEHYLTLEKLEIYYSDVVTYIKWKAVKYINWKVQILSICPNLHTFVIMDDGDSYGTSFFDARRFIDQDPHTGALKTWACESSLKTLKISITGVPRPDLNGDGVLPETYPGQGREIQGLIYDRLARLTHLKTLWLAQPYQHYIREDCLEMSLESGLPKLAGLKELKELNIECLKTRIGAQEVQWMVDQWPKLRTILGLDTQRSREAKEAVEWFKKHHWRIETSW
ncbi:MAG: hypothetical protein J3Q66DRAFT_390894 [Benniella sp.]|nr:MAG: hypothetical protein J3Q66DRAFT_390894 [Benniella sp.]